jgi:hypothetical protein
MDVWMLGCMDVGMYGRWDVWTLGCLDVWTLGCLDVGIITETSQNREPSKKCVKFNLKDEQGLGFQCFV